MEGGILSEDKRVLLVLAMLDSMSPYDAQRVKLEECIVLASKIAACEADERIKRATVMYCMERTVDGFPVSSRLSSSEAF